MHLSLSHTFLIPELPSLNNLTDILPHNNANWLRSYVYEFLKLSIKLHLVGSSSSSHSTWRLCWESLKKRGSSTLGCWVVCWWSSWWKKEKLKKRTNTWPQISQQFRAEMNKQNQWGILYRTHTLAWAHQYIKDNIYIRKNVLYWLLFLQ